MSKTTLDLSTLSDITEGTHTVKVKAKADGYNDSEFSNEVSYTKVAPIYSGEFTVTNSNPTRPYTNVTIEYNGTTYTLTPSIRYEVYRQPLNIKAGESFTWSIDSYQKIKVNSYYSCEVIDSGNRSGSAKPTGDSWQFSTRISD